MLSMYISKAARQINQFLFYLYKVLTQTLRQQLSNLHSKLFYMYLNECEVSITLSAVSTFTFRWLQSTSVHSILIEKP